MFAAPKKEFTLPSRERSPSPASPGTDRPRGRAKSRPRKIDVRELEDRFKDLQQQRKNDEIERRETERQKKRQTSAQRQNLVREQKLAEKDLLRREQDVGRLEKNLIKVERDSQSKNTRQSGMISKIDDNLKRLQNRHKELEEQLEQKLAESAIAKGRLAHVEFAHNLLTQSQVNVTLTKSIEEIANGSEADQRQSYSGALVAISPHLSYSRREQELELEAEHLKLMNRRRAEENARLRRQVEEQRRLSASRVPKPLFACLGGDLGGGTFYNLWDEGLDTELGPGFSFFAAIRHDQFNRGSKIFDFGGGEAADNIFVGNDDETNTLVFSTYQGRKGCTLTINDFWPIGETHEYLFVVGSEGVMKVYCDGELVGSRKAPPLRTVERSNLYVGRSNWPQDAPFEGSVAHIKVWNREVEWSSAERSCQTSNAETWALGHSPPPPTSSSCTYPGGLTLNFYEFRNALAAVAVANAAQRDRILREIECGNHMRLAAWAYQTHGWDFRGNLSWQNGEILDFVSAFFDELSLAPPDEFQLYPLYAKFCTGNASQLTALECLCLGDAALRAVFFSDAVWWTGGQATDLNASDNSEGFGSVGLQPESSSQPASPSRTLGDRQAAVVGSSRRALSPTESQAFSNAASSRSSAMVSTFTPGERIEALYSNGHWYPATVRSLNVDGSFSIAWDDGVEHDLQKTPAEIRRKMAPQPAVASPAVNASPQMPLGVASPLYRNPSVSKLIANA